MTKNVFDVFIIGAGPAGMTASIYASRANLKTAMIDKDAPGGKVLKTSIIENWTGYKEITGPDLAVEMYQHSIAFGSKHLFGEVTKINNIGDNIKEIIVNNKIKYFAKTIIIATGTREREMGIKGEKELYGSLISYCAICDGAIHKGKVIIVIGGGNSALEEALYLTSFASKVKIIYRRDKFFRAEQKTIDMVLKNNKIETIMNSTPLSIDKIDDGLCLTYKQNDEIKKIKAGALFPYIGADPETSFLDDKEILDNQKYIIGNELGITNYPGVFVAGDVRVKKLRQIATAVSDGCNSAQEAIEYLSKND